MIVLAVVVSILASVLVVCNGMPESCLPGVDLELVQNNRQCEGMGFPSPFVTVEACCGFITPDEANEPDVCRTITASAPYCEDGVGCVITKDDEVIISMSFAATGADDTCCRSCMCQGDPDCRSFDGTRNSWVLCDARNVETCQQKKSVCRKQRDHTGRRCEWNKEFTGWQGSGGPCQPNWEKSGNPVMEMYSTGKFSLLLTLGERGVISAITIHEGETGAEYTMTSESCFDHDPRDVGVQNAGDAWVSTSGAAIPDSWTVSMPNEVEIRWLIKDIYTGTRVSAFCTRVPGTERTRFDVREVYTFSEVGPDESGFCVTNEIDRGLANVKFNNSRNDFAFQQRCLERDLPQLVVACKALTGSFCNQANVDSHIAKWCDQADLTRSDAAGSVEQCKNLLLNGKEKKRASEWAKMVCQINRETDIHDCMSLIAQFGWDEYLQTHSDGLVDAGNMINTCTSNVSVYSILEDTTCAQGVAVEYEVESGEWEQAFFIPQDLPPCNDALIVNGEQYPMLFNHRIRFRQCGLNRRCLEENGCQPTVGFTAGLNFFSVCEAQRPECFEQYCALDSMTARQPQEICEEVPDDLFPIGQCDSCCVEDGIFSDVVIPGNEPECREIRTQSPYCDVEKLGAAFCQKLETDQGEGTVKLRLELNETEPQCCLSCSAFGDPLIRSFAGAKNKWILCDGRNSGCAIKKSVCKKQKDHMGNPCLWNKKINKKYKQFRGNVGAYGSPCQPDFAKSGDADLLMYEQEGFRITVTNGERGVITHFRIDLPVGTYDFNADKCFRTDPLAPWSAREGSFPIEAALQLGFSETSRENEHQHTVVDPVTEVFVKVVCVRRVSQTGDVGGFRLNIEALIVSDPEIIFSGDTSGFCVDGSINTGLSTINSHGDHCQENAQSIQEFCRAVSSPTCNVKNARENANAWCTKANLFPTDLNHVQQCRDFIGTQDSNNHRVLNRWVEIWCVAVAPRRDIGQSVAQWVDFCKSRAQNEGFEQVVEMLGDGSMVSAAFGPNQYCATSLSEYGLSSEADPCVPGIRLEVETSPQVWEEVAFIPKNFVFCGDEMEVSAKDFPQLFTHPFRFIDCKLNRDECPPESNEEAYCAPAQGFSVWYKFSQPASVCEGNEL